MKLIKPKITHNNRYMPIISCEKFLGISRFFIKCIMRQPLISIRYCIKPFIKNLI